MIQTNLVYSKQLKFIDLSDILRKPTAFKMQTRLLVCVIASTILLTEPFSFASPVDNSKIVNGVLVNPGEFPYVVTLQVNDRHICNGFIYNELWVVTAASCVEQYYS